MLMQGVFCAAVHFDTTVNLVMKIAIMVLKFKIQAKGGTGKLHQTNLDALTTLTFIQENELVFNTLWFQCMAILCAGL